MFICAVTMLFPGFTDLFIPMPFHLSDEYTVQCYSLLGAVNLFVPRAFAVQTDCRRVKSVECGYTDFVSTPMVDI